MTRQDDDYQAGWVDGWGEGHRSGGVDLRLFWWAGFLAALGVICLTAAAIIVWGSL